MYLKLNFSRSLGTEKVKNVSETEYLSFTCHVVIQETLNLENASSAEKCTESINIGNSRAGEQLAETQMYVSETLVDLPGFCIARLRGSHFPKFNYDKGLRGSAVRKKYHTSAVEAFR